MSLSTIIGLLRNSLCCVKDVQYYIAPYSPSFVHPTPLHEVLTNSTGLNAFFFESWFSSPLVHDIVKCLKMTSLLDFVIAALQIYAFFQLSYSGVTSLFESAAKLQSLSVWSKVITEKRVTISQSKTAISSADESSDSAAAGADGTPARRSARKPKSATRSLSSSSSDPKDADPSSFFTSTSLNYSAFCAPFSEVQNINGFLSCPFNANALPGTPPGPSWSVSLG